MSDTTHEFRTEANTDDDVRLALSAVAAIQRLIEERNELRGRLAAQDRELARLRRSLSNIRETYRKLTSDFVTRMQSIDGAITEVQGTPEPASSHTQTTHRTAETSSSSSDRSGY